MHDSLLKVELTNHGYNPNNYNRQQSGLLTAISASKQPIICPSAQPFSSAFQLSYSAQLHRPRRRSEGRGGVGMSTPYAIMLSSTVPPSDNLAYHSSGITVLRGLDLGALF